MKNDMNALKRKIKLTLNWFGSTLFRLEIRANLPGVGAGVVLRGIGAWRIDSRKTWFVSSRQINIISFTIIHLSFIFF